MGHNKVQIVTEKANEPEKVDGENGKPKPAGSSTYEPVFRWWQKPSIKYAFSHPYVRSRLEKLMGSNVVNLTDREYMQLLQERILENYANEMNKRIATREAEEMERVKNLVLIGRIPLDEAPPEMVDHPVRLIEMHCRRLIAERRAKIKVHKGFIPKHLYVDDTPDPPSGLSIEEGHVFRSKNERLCHPPACVLSIPDKEDVKRGYMFTEENYAKLNLEGSLIQELRKSQTVEEMYQLADRIMGITTPEAEQ
ncbi:hypothetical protein PPYR_08439 [Photinus pyralis]|uniref:Uncharacterized protein n=1 Tax=Photinus pyralis TaxID=7054 RepID=A0A5N4AJB9_PHOPY|nr:uncharacterized protein LOC116172224 isoform X2 [Photinus pyralis]KAB0797445.1 hypothetical protein PPYR_08439 [Photinus pyralis]